MVSVYSLCGNLVCHPDVEIEDILMATIPIYTLFRNTKNAITRSVVSVEDFAQKDPHGIAGRVHIVRDYKRIEPTRIVVATSGRVTERTLPRIVAEIPSALKNVCEPGQLQLIDMMAKSRKAPEHTQFLQVRETRDAQCLISAPDRLRPRAG